VIGDHGDVMEVCFGLKDGGRYFLVFAAFSKQMIPRGFDASSSLR
jgi:hypothetical protein